MTAALPPLDEAMLARRLLTDAGGSYSRITRVESVGSTNQWLIDALTAESRAHRPGQGQTRTEWPHLSVLTAEEQTGGRGRLGRVWSSPKGASLSTSIVLRPQFDPSYLGWLSMLAGRALVDTLRHDVGLDTEGQRAVLKWPNDVQVTQPEGPARKISGILASVVAGAPGTGPAAVVVLGAGINVLLTPEQLPIENSTSVLIELHRRRTDPRAESSDEPDHRVNQAVEPLSDAGSLSDVESDSDGAGRLRSELLCCYLERFADLLGVVEAAARDAPETVPQVLIRLVGEVLTTLGHEVRVELPDGSAERGVAQGLTSQGALDVKVAARRTAPEQDWTPLVPQLKSFSAGDVTHLRPTS
ncbi:biotin--[acetyl-CoA-carboxylase] ligase [Nesterenkonia sp. CF4.4]|uniref:biotin--[acetyl-CoA-carboxylase] ligase n=1 Tax=Nesterenkonia sp. CF4.4 TaxID=3373079 RepID=UPI003EE67DA1